MTNWKSDRIGSCLTGQNPTMMVQMKSGFAVIGDNQYLPGYCLLLGHPKAPSLNELTMPQRSQYLLDMTLIGDAIIKTCNPLRINYATLMNLDNYLHTHIEARYDWEPEEYKRGPSWSYPKDVKYAPEYEYSEESYGQLKRDITANLLALMGEAGY